MLQPRPPPLTPPHRGLFDSHFSESDSSPMGYADPPLGTTAYAGSESRDSKDSRFSASDIDRANQKCAFNSRVGGEGRGEGASPRVVANIIPRGNSAPLTPTLSPQERGEGARAQCGGVQAQCREARAQCGG